MIDANTQWMLRRDAQLCGDEDENVGQRAQIEAALADVHTCCPGIISSFDSTTLTVEVRPALRKLLFPDGVQGTWVDLPLLVDVPVVVLAGAGFALTFPIRPGDECLLLFAERSFDNWHEQGDVSEQATMRKHSLSDAFALVGVRSKPNMLASYNTQDAELRSADGQTRVRLGSDGGLHLQQGANSIDMTFGEIAITSNIIRLSGQVILDHTMQGEGGAGANFTGDVTAGGVSVMNHLHTGVQSGSSISGPPK